MEVKAETTAGDADITHFAQCLLGSFARHEAGKGKPLVMTSPLVKLESDGLNHAWVGEQVLDVTLAERVWQIANKESPGRAGVKARSSATKK